MVRFRRHGSVPAWRCSGSRDDSVPTLASGGGGRRDMPGRPAWWEQERVCRSTAAASDSSRGISYRPARSSMSSNPTRNLRPRCHSFRLRERHRSVAGAGPDRIGPPDTAIRHVVRLASLAQPRSGGCPGGSSGPLQPPCGVVEATEPWMGDEMVGGSVDAHGDDERIDGSLGLGAPHRPRSGARRLAHHTSVAKVARIGASGEEKPGAAPSAGERGAQGRGEARGGPRAGSEGGRRAQSRGEARGGPRAEEKPETFRGEEKPEGAPLRGDDGRIHGATARTCATRRGGATRDNTKKRTTMRDTRHGDEAPGNCAMVRPRSYVTMRAQPSP